MSWKLRRFTIIKLQTISKKKSDMGRKAKKMSCQENISRKNFNRAILIIKLYSVLNVTRTS